MATAVAVHKVGSGTNLLVDLFKSPEDAAADDALQELNSYLSRLLQEDLRSLRSRRSSVASESLGDCCRECRASESPLATAVENCHVPCVREITRAQPSVDVTKVCTSSGAPLPHAAARRGSLETLQLLADRTHNQSLCSVRDQRGATPLHSSAYYGQLECLEFMLGKGSQADLEDHEGALPLHFAAVSGNLQCLKALVSSMGQDQQDQVNAATRSGETAGEWLNCPYSVRCELFPAC